MTGPYYADATVTVHAGDCLDVLRAMPDASVDAVVTDPPYNLGFMGKQWDRIGGMARATSTSVEKAANPYGRARTEYGGASYGGSQLESMRAFGDWCELWATECLRVLKPGGHLASFGGTRTFHRLACAIEDAGFEIRPALAWLFASGFPKSLNVGKAIDTKFCRAAGTHDHEPGETCPEVPEGDPWRGFGTDTKPAFEPVVVARKPLAGTVAGNVLAHGTGALNIDGCRIEGGERPVFDRFPGERPRDEYRTGTGSRTGEMSTAGRWPANVVLDEGQAEALDAQSGERLGFSGGGTKGAGFRADYVNGERRDTELAATTFNDTGGASRFFYVAEADATRCPLCGRPAHDYRCDAWPTAQKVECDCYPGGFSPETYEGPQPWCPVHGETGARLPIDDLGPRFTYTAKAATDERVRVAGVSHPTVKPLALMRWLVRLVTPPGGIVLEPFAGSGTTVEACILEGFRCIAIEREPDYLPLIVQRINRRRDPVAAVRDAGDDGGLFDLLDDGMPA